MTEKQPTQAGTEKKKKRRWDIPDPTAATTSTSSGSTTTTTTTTTTLATSPTPTSPTSPTSATSPTGFSTTNPTNTQTLLSSALSQIAAKLTPTPPVNVTDPTQAAQIAASKISQLMATKGVTTKTQIFTAEVEINHCRPDIRYYLTKGTTHEEIFKETGAFISSKGRYKPPGDTSEERALYLLISADKKEAVEKAEAKIREIMSRGSERTQVTTKVFVGLDNVEPSFALISRLLGKQGTNVKYIATESGAKITLKGRGTEHTSGDENDPLHFYIVAPSQKNLDTAKSLVENLINHIKQEYEKWKQTVKSPTLSPHATSPPQSAAFSPPYPYTYPSFVPPNYSPPPPMPNVPGYPPPPPPYPYPPPLYPSSPPSMFSYPGGYSPPPPTQSFGYPPVSTSSTGQFTESNPQNQPLYPPTHTSQDLQNSGTPSEVPKPKRHFQEFVDKGSETEPPIGPKRPTPEEIESAVLPEVIDTETETKQKKEMEDRLLMPPPPPPPKGVTGKKRTNSSEETSSDSKRQKTETTVKLVDYETTEDDDNEKRSNEKIQQNKDIKRPFWAAPPLDPVPPLAAYSNPTSAAHNKSTEEFGNIKRSTNEKDYEKLHTDVLKDLGIVKPSRK